jgi:hypothetical protein
MAIEWPPLPVRSVKTLLVGDATSVTPSATSAELLTFCGMVRALVNNYDVYDLMPKKLIKSVRLSVAAIHFSRFPSTPIL